MLTNEGWTWLLNTQLLQASVGQFWDMLYAISLRVSGGDGTIATHNDNPLWMYLLSVSLLSLSHSTYSLIHTLRDHLPNKQLAPKSWLQHLVLGEPNQSNDHQNLSCLWEQLALGLQHASMRAELGWWPNCSVSKSNPLILVTDQLPSTMFPHLCFLRLPSPPVYMFWGAPRSCSASNGPRGTFPFAIRF